ncbi:GNAT family N-acetyltransferase [Jejuia spongiicola]|uniref:GNAT family N-acetyltransferase n=1 Tax=Jejuia spongiicola TaxID=2942207 RepID=A0ABT0QHI2_9FLAO|nr:GNAT family N-acetyltransferase [Jejuia spongiicola]MCL6296304.1 GNAT family N-acetyltransferase [Jejuia spongiicola]
MIIAETERLLISKVSLQDAPFFVELMNTPHWLKYIGDRNIRSVKDAEANLKNGILKSYKDNGFGFYKVLLKAENNKTIGTAGLIKREQLDDVDVGFGFLPEYEGKGFGFEASVEIMKLAKSEFKLKKVVAITNPDNHNSIKLLEKLGLVFEKRVNPFEEDKELLLFAKTL